MDTSSFGATAVPWTTLNSWPVRPITWSAGSITPNAVGSSIPVNETSTSIPVVSVQIFALNEIPFAIKLTSITFVTDPMFELNS